MPYHWFMTRDSELLAKYTPRTLPREFHWYRDTHGLPRLHESKLLNTAAELHGRHMWENDYYAHNWVGTTPKTFVDEVGYAHRGVEECIWWTPKRTMPRTVIQAWHDSPGHRAIMQEARPEFSEFGIATVRFDDAESAHRPMPVREYHVLLLAIPA